MKISVSKQDLDLALQVVNPCIAGTGADLTTHYLFRNHADDGKAEVLTNAGRVYSGCPFVATVELDDADGAFNAFTIEGKRLRTLLGAVPEAVIIFSFDDAKKKVTVRAGDGPKQSFQSLDPENFSYYDKRFGESEEAVTLPANRLHAALSYAKPFASNEDNRTPELCLCEVRGGGMAASDKKAAAVIAMSQLTDDVSFRVHTKNVPTVLSFLAPMGADDVTVHTHERCVFFTRANGAIMGESRHLADFPKFKTPTGDDQRFWTLSVAGLKSALNFLKSGAAGEDNRLHLTREDDGPVKVSMMNTTGSRTEYPVECVESGEADKAPDFPETGFVVAFESLQRLLASAEGDTVRLGINVRAKVGGFVRHVWERFGVEEEGGNPAVEGDIYITVIPWLK